MPIQTQNIDTPTMVIYRARALLQLTGEDINLTGVEKNGEYYFFLYDDNNCDEALRVLGRFASNPELNLIWPDIAIMALKIKGRNNLCNVPQGRTGDAK